MPAALRSFQQAPSDRSQRRAIDIAESMSCSVLFHICIVFSAQPYQAGSAGSASLYAPVHGSYLIATCSQPRNRIESESSAYGRQCGRKKASAREVSRYEIAASPRPWKGYREKVAARLARISLCADRFCCVPRGHREIRVNK